MSKRNNQSKTNKTTGDLEDHRNKRAKQTTLSFSSQVSTESDSGYKSNQELLVQSDSSFQQSQTENNDTSTVDLRSLNSKGLSRKRNREHINGTQSISDFRDGSILKIVVKNFLAYDNCELRPGSHLNMIIGPNGTGKSTIVCAIALGLGGSPNLLGRSTEVKGFVKHGCDKGWVEITLKGPGKDKVTVIRRTISASSNSSSYTINGGLATFSKVVEITKRLNIQIDNLCQFLAQDKVVEFSKMNGAEMLKATQRAVGKENLAELQQQLVELKAEEMRANYEIDQEKEAVEHLEKQRERLRKEVERFEEYQRLEKQIQALRYQIPFAKYNLAQLKYSESKSERNMLKDNYNKLVKEQGPIKRIIEKNEQLIRNTRQEVLQRQGEIGSKKSEIDIRLNKIDKLEQKINDKRNEIKEIEKYYERLELEKAELEQEIRQMEKGLGERPSDSGIAEANKMIEEVMKKEKEIRINLREVQEQIINIKNAAREGQSGLNQLTEELQRLEDVKTQRIQVLKRYNADTVKGLEWLDSRRTEFSEHVFGPVALELRLVDSKHADTLEALIQPATLKSFVCQNERDYRHLTKRLNDEMKLRTNAVMLSHLNLEDFKPPFSRTELKKWGFDCFATDLVQAPPPVTVALCNSDHLHRIPISFNGNIDHEALAQTGMLKTYIANGVKYQVTRSRYGKKQVFTTTSRVKVKNPQDSILSNGDSVELQRRRVSLGEQIEKIREEQTANQGKIKKLLAQESKFNQAIESDIQPQLSHQKRVKETIHREIQVWERSRVKLESKKARLIILASDLSLSAKQAKEAKVIESIKSTSSEKLVLISRASKEFTDVVHLENQLVLTHHQLYVAQSQLQTTKQSFAETLERIESASVLFEQASENFKKAKAYVSQCLENLELAARETELSSEELESLRDSMSESSESSDLQHLEISLTSALQRLSLFNKQGLSTASHGAVKEYKSRLQDVESKRARITSLQSKLSKLAAKKQTLRNSWEPPLRELVDNISTHFAAAMQTLNCLGEVRLVTNINASGGPTAPQFLPRRSDSLDEQFDLWGIHVYVSFRSNEPVQLLTNHRQSGGERAVSTALYLQALQAAIISSSLSQGSVSSIPPFRVVDEVNQGMDPKNERLIHSLIVNSTTIATSDVDSSQDSVSTQFFLITPKLLTNLDYHENIKIHVIYNGEWQPERFSLSDYIPV
ncbi:Structural maintenance of chromosomes protein 5 [Zancudomyces culisetae]|uniref:Structural maintenance of chromosomes protein 5 n=1 Tax=Zancudomyces culisetae TaxID=1213189 RepID=A0A1R1PYS0_ZANCU|nr:Structural maintenance of chromosomes protein 5 [Zancudomyces culisetae]|eukprot:OMH86116.1 Structural maintenance of chromosomes protein 5 [Zancudomyces culisetae]